MIVCIQRVSRAGVTIDGEMVGQIGRGVLLLVGVEKGDDVAVVPRVADKIARMRIFAGEDDRMNLDILKAGGEILAVSQFTLAGSIRRGRRPSFDGAADPAIAQPLFDALVSDLRGYGIHVETGRFGAHMMVELVNDGPVTFIGSW